MHVQEKYRLGSRLGVGGMADVFRAELTGAEGFSRPVAIKRLHAAVSSDPAFCAMFVREARLLSALHHPSIVSVLDFDWDGDGRLFLAMELVDGVNLAELVRGGPLPLAVAEHVMAEVLRGLGHAHARGILHRDVTPHNVLLSWAGEVKLSDFGLAQASASSRVSDGGLIRGKVPYLSPEQLQGLTIDARSDLFSAGVMSYQLLTGRYPFVGRTDQATMAESIARMLTATIVPPRDLRPEVPAELSDVVMRLLERDRERRYLSAEMVLADMPVPARGRELLADLLAERFPGGVVDATSAAAGQGRAERDTSAPWRRRHTASLPGLQAQPGARGHARASRRWLPGLALGLLVIALTVVITWHWPRTTEAAGDRIEQAASGPGAGPGASMEARPAERKQASGSAAPGRGLDAVPAAIVVSPGTPRSIGQSRPGDPGAAAGRTSGRASGHARSLAGRAPHDPPAQARAPQRVQAAAIGGPADVQASAPRPPVAAPATQPGTSPSTQTIMHSGTQPAQPQAERGYERGWTEIEPQQTLTGEIPIRREVP